MPGTRTAPTAQLTSTTDTYITVHCIDASGDLYADSIKVDGFPDDGSGAIDYAAIESRIASYQAATNASVYQWSIALVGEGVSDADNAVAAYRATVASGVNMLMRNTTLNKTTTPRLVAPVATTMQGNQDIPLLLDGNGDPTPLGDLVTANLALLSGYDLSSIQFTGRRERKNNPRIKT